MKKLAFCFGVFISLLVAHQGFCFNSLTHEQITKSAFRYLNTHVHLSPATQKWLDAGSNEDILQRLIVRQVVDTDYRDDIWLKTFFHKSFTGAVQGSKDPNVMVTMYLHFINMKGNGGPWPKHNGYSYDDTSEEDNDGILGLSFLELAMKRSAAFGGRYGSYPLTGPDYGDMKIGYALEDEAKLYTLKENSDNDFSLDPEKVVFPPATVPAQMAYDKMLASVRYSGSRTRITKWEHKLPLFPARSFSDIFTAIFTDTNIKYSHSYWRAEIPNLPSKLDLLGVTIHMAQDLSMPHHTHATSNFCHAELEEAVDFLACGKGAPPPYPIYDKGTFDDGDGRFRECQELYDADLVNLIMSDPAFVQEGPQPFGDEPQMISDRIHGIAKFTSAWAWGFSGPREKYRTDLPMKRYRDGITWMDASARPPIFQKKCSRFWRIPEIQEQLKIQYNVAVAATAMILELAARDYESR